MEQEAKPQWLLELESRKRKPRLAHETGAGAPCLTCESACPGLDLHFWRKICKNCKCRGDSHDFDDDDFPQFELLFGPHVKKNKKNRAVLLPVNDKKQVNDRVQTETPFEWIPPDTTKELAADYMKALPSEKLPIKGSPGAALRKQQLQKQLPLHDIDHKACDGLSEQERREFERYLDNLKNCAGQGKVSKLTSIRPFDKSLMTPANATDVQRFSPQHSQNLSNPKGELNLRTPSSFIPKVPYTQKVPQTKSSLPNSPNERGAPLAYNTDSIRGQHTQLANQSNPILGQYHHALANVSNQASLAEAANVPGAYHLGSELPNSNDQSKRCQKHNPTPYELKYSKNPASIINEECDQDCKAPQTSESLSNELRAHTEKIGAQTQENLEFSSALPSRALLAEQMLCEALLPPSAANAGNIVGSSLDEKGLLYIREKLSDKYGIQNDPVPLPSRELDHIGHHPSVSISEQVQRAAERTRELESKPSHNNNDSNANQMPSHLPYTAQSERLQAELSTSLPVHSNVIHSQVLNNPVFPEDPVGASVAFQNPEAISQLQEEMEAMTTNVTRAHQCHKCAEDIHCGDVVVTAEKITDAVWHPGCFVCSACSELLVDLVYFTYKGKLYCGRDLALLLEIPRCFACDELIFVREYTVAEGHNYHVKHFCCWDCDIPLAGQQYISENDRPLCLPCYQNNYAKTCNTCNNVIAADQQGVAIKNLNFHATSDCFCCFTCKKSLLAGQIAIKENRTLCSKECIAEFLHRRALGR